MSYYWLDLLKRKMQYGTGLTIPFLIGAKELLEQDLTSIEDLLNEMLDSNESIVIKYCFDVREYICTLNTSLAKGYYKNIVEFDNLIIVEDYSFLKGINDFDDVIETFELFYSENIELKKYSRVYNSENDDWSWDKLIMMI